MPATLIFLISQKICLFSLSYLLNLNVNPMTKKNNAFFDIKLEKERER